MKARGSAYVLLILLIAANSGCLAPRSDPPAAKLVSPVVSYHTSASVDINQGEHPGSDLLLFRAASSEEPEMSIFSTPSQSNVGLPSELQTLPLNPVIGLLTGNSTSQSSQEAYTTLGLLG